MKISFTLVSISIAMLFAFSSKVFSQDLTPEQIYEKVNDCVVVILSYDFDGNLSKQGSGVVISDKGWVVTNYHVFAECEKVEIKHNDKTISYSDIIGVDVEKDILILKIDENIFPTISISNDDNLKVGQRVYAIGSPLGMENSLSEGLISGLRNVSKENRNYIQITAGVSPGSSGGAVVNSKGELIGISSSSLEGGQNLNFAIPVNDIFEIFIGSFNSKKDIEANNYFYKGYNACNNGNYEDAIKYLTSYLNIFPDAEGVYNNRGIAYYFLKEYNKAISDYGKAIEINPEFEIAYNNRGSAYRNLEEYYKAILDYSKAIEINSIYSNAYHNRGIVYLNLKEYNNAIFDFSKTIEINPEYSTAYIYRGIVYEDLEEYNKAISDFSKAIEINPDDAIAYFNRGVAYKNSKEYSKAISDYSKAIEINPNEAETYYNRGIAYYILKMTSKACEDIKIAFSLGSQKAMEFLQEVCR